MTSRLAKVKVRLVVEVDVQDTWGDGTSIGQVRSQGVSAATAALRKRLTQDGPHSPSPAIGIVRVEACDMVVPLEES